MKEEHPFIKETIKKETPDVGAQVRRIATLAVGGVVFGICAALSMAAFLPVAGGIMGVTPTPELQVTLAPGDEGEEESAAPMPEPSVSAEDSEQAGEISRPLEYYEHIYEEALHISEEPRKALVQVSAMRGGENLLDESLLRWGDEEGIIFLCSDSNYYILSTCESLLKSDDFRVTFSNGDTVRGYLCKADARTGLAVVRVPVISLSEEARREISVAKLSTTCTGLQAKPAIAIGSPVGDYDAVVYGMITSVSGRYTVADAEYNYLTTDMKGSVNGTGMLLDAQGDVIGFILRTGEDSDIIRAVSVAQLRPLVQTLSNGEDIRYLGIRGITVTEARANALKIPQGIYVDSVETDSPAMRAGILSGDIITGLGDAEVKTMESYTDRLQKLSVGGQTMVRLWRRGAEGVYGEMKLRVTVDGK